MNQLDHRALHFAALPDDLPAEEGELALSPPGEYEIVTQKATAPALQRALRTLRSKATQVFNDYGLWTLQLGIGILHWREDGASTSSQAPLILFPVELVRTSTGQVLLQANKDEDPQLNPALPIRLEQFGIDWAPVADTDCRDMDAVIAAVRKAVAGKSLWKVEERAIMALFASHKESMHQDLLENESRLVSSDLVRAVALGAGNAVASDRFDFEEVPSERVDELTPPEDTPLVLDADTSQRQAIAAAVAGRSFVLDGPPGTGKSQTITNIIAGLMHAGRSVLFVSEKAAALDVVLQRLKSVGLDSYAFALHSRNTSRKAVAQELGRALSEQPQASGLPDRERMQAQLDRKALSAYATAMNEVRQPLGRTLHDVIGRVGQLEEAPVAYLSTSGDDTSRQFDASSLSSVGMDDVLTAAKDIGEAWQAVADPDFPWRGLRTDSPHPGPALEEARTSLTALLAALDGYQDLNTAGAPFTTSDQVDRLVRLLDLLDARQPVPPSWLTDTDAAVAITDPVESFLNVLRRVQRAQQTARDLVGVRWQEISPRLRPQPPTVEEALAALEPRGLELAGLTEHQAQALRLDFSKAADLLTKTTASACELTRLLCVDEPRSLAEATDLCDLADLSDVPHRPLKSWFAPADFAATQKTAVDVVAAAVEEFEARRGRTVAARTTARKHAGPGWADMPSHLPQQPGAAERAVAALQPPGVDLTDLGRDEAESLASHWGVLADVLESTAKCAVDASDLLGCESPDDASGTRSVTELAMLATVAHRAPGAWFDPAVLPRVRQVVDELHCLMDGLDACRRKAQDVFGPDTPRTAGLTDAVRRLSENGRRLAAGLFPQVRADRKLVGGISVNGSWKSDLLEELSKAAAWQQAHQSVRIVMTEHADLLGAYAGDDLPDRDALAAALRQAEDAHRLAPTVLADPARRRCLVAQLAEGSATTPALIEWGKRLEDDLGTWASALQEPRLRRLGTPPAHLAPAAASTWLRAHVPALEDAVRLIDAVQSMGRREFAEGTAHTLTSARAAIAAAHTAQREDATFVAHETQDRDLLGSWYAGLDTRIDEQLQDTRGTAVEDELLCRARRQSIADGGSRTDATPPGAVELLGEYAPAGRPRTAALAASLAVAAKAHRLVGPVLANPAPRGGVAHALASGQPAVPSLLETAARLREQCADWETFTDSPALAPAASGLRARSLPECTAWLRAHLEPLDQAASLVHSVALDDTSWVRAQRHHRRRSARSRHPNRPNHEPHPASPRDLRERWPPAF